MCSQDCYMQPGSLCHHVPQNHTATLNVLDVRAPEGWVRAPLMITAGKPLCLPAAACVQRACTANAPPAVRPLAHDP